MLAPTNFKVRFQEVWLRALKDYEHGTDVGVRELMQLLEQFLEVEQIENVNVGNSMSFLFDFSTLGFSGLGWNVVVVSPPPTNDAESRWQAEFLAEQKQATDSIGLCFHIYLVTEYHQKNPHIGSGMETVYLCRDELDKIFSASIPKMAFAAIIRQQTPVTRLCPYNTNQEAAGAMFFGRRRELSLVVDETSKSIAIQGARRIGKTSLLKQSYRIMRNRYHIEGRSRVFYFNCLTWSNYSHACHMLAHKIDPKRESRLERADKNIEYMLERCSRGGTRPLYLFLDEVDRLIDLDRLNGWRFFSLLAWAKDAGMVRIVLAGYRSIAKLVYGQQGRGSVDSCGAELVADTPLLCALEPLTLAPLDRKDTDLLIAEPLRSAELQLQNESQILERVWKATMGYPFLVQFFGQQLFRSGVERLNQVVLPEDVCKVEESSELHEFLETHFIENTLYNGMPVCQERACAFLFAHSNAPSWTEQDFWEACQHHRISMGIDELGAIHRAVKNLTDAQVLAYSHGRFSFAFPVMGKVLKSAYPCVQKGIKALTGC
jgi:hypothetical protein